MSSLADRLYPSAAEPGAPPAAVEPNPRVATETPAVRSEVPADIAAERKVDVARTMFGGTTFVSELPDGSLPAKYDIAEVRQVAQDLGATSEDVSMFRELAVHLAEPVSDQVFAGWETQAIADLQRLNVTQAELDDAKALVARDPRTFALLESSGLGSHPKIVQRFIELGRSARAAGKLSRK